LPFELAYGSLALDSNSAIAMTIAGLTEAMSRNPDKAIELLRRAQRLSPRDPRGWLTASMLSLAYLTEGQFEEAASSAKRPLMPAMTKKGRSDQRTCCRRN
jgi:Flp pilus assembly protein TadD